MCYQSIVELAKKSLKTGGNNGEVTSVLPQHFLGKKLPGKNCCNQKKYL